jgi:gamma-glutamyltranspeptidase
LFSPVSASLAQVIVNILDWNGCSVIHYGTAHDLRRSSGIWTRITPVFKVENRISKDVMDGLRSKGYTVEPVADDEGRVSAIVIDPRTHFYLGGADPREDVYAIGW